MSWRSAVKYPYISHRLFSLFGHQFPHDPVLSFGLAVAIFVAASVAYNSPFRPDRFLFSSTAVALLTALIRQFATLTPFSLLALKTTDALMWTLGAAVCVGVLAGWNGNAQGNGQISGEEN